MYLRLPSIVGRKKNAVLGFLKERMRKRINGWEGRFLSRAGKEILIKTVVQSLPSYDMNVFLFPIGTCNELERMIASFWWKSNNSTSNGSGITWMSWDKMTKCNKVFKARYYPQGDYLSTELGWNPSFIWSSIFAARDTVKLGLRKRIGSGTTMQITTDPWLPVIDHSVHVPKVHGLENFTVNSLFQVNNRCWDKKSGFYSVRSAYNLLQDLKHHSDNSEINVFWKNLWTLKVPPKAKDLVWRAASNCLATKRNLCIKKVLVDSTCPMCGVFAETEWHILVSCDFAWSCLGYAGLAAVGRDSFTSLLSWLDATARRVSSETLDQWVNAQGKGNIPLLSPLKDGDGAEQWIKPSSGIKLNVDGAIFASLLKHGFGCVVRNTDGGLVSAFAGVKNGSVTPELAEIISIREALSWLKNHAFSRATLETDSLVCVKAIRSEETFSSTFGLVVDDCKNILKNLFNVSILFVKRSANRAVHFVAQHSVSLAERMFSINSVSLNLMSILASDCSI
ncbi:uncharacterized protein LOC115717764 [Cannabis sativa]|uniref:uncharacterized protein LOC115717764 n=1 Tax=Cannabis sativa TaxID=3483 RepID=UPI0029CA8E7B|nr:uncharacterized protein LOC115717764 [Cannabis sativa]